MSKFYAKRITKIDELDTAVKQNAAVILVDNNNITKKIKEICAHDLETQQKANAALKRGGKSTFAAAGFFALGFVGSIFFEPLVIVGAIGTALSTLFGALNIAAGAGRKIFDSGELRNYKWFESNKKLVLYKYRGENKYDPNVDELVDFGKGK